MASPMIFLGIATILLVAAAEAKHGGVVAPGPTPAPLNLTAILEKGSQYTTLIRLLKETQIGEQIQSQLNSSFDGLTVFAPTDNAFSNLKPGTLNSLAAQEQVALILYHVLPRYYSLATFETASNPVRTQASGSQGVYSVNVTSTSSQVNVSTGVDETQISNDLYTDFPLAVYSVDKVLLPYELFGPQPPEAAPAPVPTPSALVPKKPAKKVPGAKAPVSSEDASATPSGASFGGRGSVWGLIAGVGLLCGLVLV